MANFNKIILAGNLTRDPEIRNIQDKNIMVASCGLAVNRKYKDKQETMFIDFNIFGKQAEVLGTYAKKGSAVLIEGRLVLNQWEQDGQKRSKHEVIVDVLQLLNSKTPEEDKQVSAKSRPYTEEITEDDVPF